MAFDEVLADRVRELTGGASEKRMFGSLAFCVGGQIAVCVMGDGLLARVGKDGLDAALAIDGVERAIIGSREMVGWVIVPGELLDDDDLLRWWHLGVAAAAAALPPQSRRRG